MSCQSPLRRECGTGSRLAQEKIWGVSARAWLLACVVAMVVGVTTVSWFWWESLGACRATRATELDRGATGAAGENAP